MRAFVLPNPSGKGAANGLVAQSVEQRIENPCVGGSIPPRATINERLAAMQAFLLQAISLILGIVRKLPDSTAIPRKWFLEW